MLEATPALRPRTWAEALELRAAHPDALAINGGTDVMVEINFARRRPAALLDLSHVPELTRVELLDGDDGGRPLVRLGAGVTYTRIVDELADLTPCLAMASRTIGSPQIRNRGTVGGNLGTASPAGDAHPPLLATHALVELESVTGPRVVSIDDFFLGPKRSVLGTDELIRAVRIPAADGPQQFSKIGPRNAMVIATTSFALCVHRGDRQIGTGIGSAGPTPLRATQAEALVAEAVDWDDPGPLDPGVAGRFGDLVAAAASPIDDVRGTARYRRHALAVLARRCLGWAWESLDGGAPMRLRITVNGRDHEVDDVWECESLLYLLRERLEQRGSKNACEQGECGSCSVLLDDVLVCACLVAAGQVDGASIVTIEGLADGDDLHPVQQAFLDAGAVQCGFCTPGLIVAVHELL